MLTKHDYSISIDICGYTMNIHSRKYGWINPIINLRTGCHCYARFALAELYIVGRSISIVCQLHHYVSMMGAHWVSI